MKKILSVIFSLFLSIFIFAQNNLLFDFVFSKPANTTSYFGTLGLSYGYEIADIFEVKHLNLRPKIGISMGTGIVNEKIGIFNVESEFLYSMVIPDISIYYYLYELKETVKKGLIFYGGFGLLVPFKMVSYSDDRIDDVYKNDFPFPSLKFGLLLKKKFLLELNLSAPSSLSFGFKF